MTHTIEYAPDRRLRVHGDGDAGIALLWHGRGPLESYAMAPLAEAVAASGVRVIAADWDSTGDDFGKADLETSLAHARGVGEELGIDPQRLVIAGWSLGGTATLGLALQSPRPLRTILVAPGYAARAIDPFSGRPLPDAFPSGQGRPIDVVWGSQDDIVDEVMAVSLVDRLRDAGWEVTATELDADHSGVVGVRFDEPTGRYVEDPAVSGVMAEVAVVVVAASRTS